MFLETQDDHVEEIEWLSKARFIRSIRYIRYMSNIVPILKKNGKLRVSHLTSRHYGNPSSFLKEKRVFVFRGRNF